MNVHCAPEMSHSTVSNLKENSRQHFLCIIKALLYIVQMWVLWRTVSLLNHVLQCLGQTILLHLHHLYAHVNVCMWIFEHFLIYIFDCPNIQIMLLLLNIPAIKGSLNWTGKSYVMTGNPFTALSSPTLFFNLLGGRRQAECWCGVTLKFKIQTFYYKLVAC